MPAMAGNFYIRFPIRFAFEVHDLNPKLLHSYQNGKERDDVSTLCCSVQHSLAVKRCSFPQQHSKYVSGHEINAVCTSIALTSGEGQVVEERQKAAAKIGSIMFAS
jgi:hypothetical protein